MTPNAELDAETPSPLILVVDDDQSHRLLMRRALEREGYEVIEAGDGAEMLVLCDERRPELVLLDAVMPGLDGFGACAELKGSGYGRDISVLMITALDDDPSVEHAFGVGASDYITKPINFSVFKQRVRRILSSTRTQKRLQQLAHQDSLTGLPNRLLFMDRFAQGIARASRAEQGLALLFIDLDRFKLINDSLGHDAGDTALQKIAERLDATMRQSDTVARLGGDEFVVLLEGVGTPEESGGVAGNILRALTQRMVLQERELSVSASVGIAMYPGDGDDIGSLMRNADAAMYRAKERGRNRFEFYSSRMNEAANHHLVLENNVREAILRKDFEIHYQPVMSLDGDRMLGTEALVRWRTEGETLVYPEGFLRLAEESGLIVPLGEWVIQTVCQRLAGWRAHGSAPGTVSINLSARQFREPGMVAELKNVLKETGVEPAWIQFEMTEQTLMLDLDAVEGTLRELHAIGFGLAIDDFGTGWSSLSYLRRFPLDSIKIDSSFVAAIRGGRDAQPIIKAVLELGRALDVNVIAEGVETDRQYQVLKTLGCEQGQGHYWSEPLPAEEYEAKFLKGS